MNNLAVAAALATSPSSAFAELRERPRFWFPLLVVVIATAGITYWYYSIVDIDWLKDLLFANNPSIPEAQRTAAMSMMTRTTLMWSSVIGSFIGIPVVIVLQALYLLVASKVTKLTPEFKHWFSFACWTTLPVLISLVVSAILLLISDTPQISPGVTQALSLNELVLHRPIGSPGQGLLAMLNIPAFLTWALMIIGVHAWSQRSWLFSTIFVLLPYVLIDALWAFAAFR